MLYIAPGRHFTGSGFSCSAADDSLQGQPNEGKYECGCVRRSQRCASGAGEQRPRDVCNLWMPQRAKHMHLVLTVGEAEAQMFLWGFFFFFVSSHVSDKCTHMPNIYCTISSSPCCQFRRYWYKIDRKIKPLLSLSGLAWLKLTVFMPTKGPNVSKYTRHVTLNLRET